MDHDHVSHAICGRYVPLSDEGGYIESHLSFPVDGTLLGAYVTERRDGGFSIVDDGDLLFTAEVAGANLSKSNIVKYRALAAECGALLRKDGVLTIDSPAEHLSYCLARYFEAAYRIAHASVGHRPKMSNRFDDTVGRALRRIFGEALSANRAVPGASGHQLRFPFALELRSRPLTLIQTVAASEDKVDWGNVYRAWGKLRDVANNEDLKARRVAVVESAEQPELDRARLALGDAADVIVFQNEEHLGQALAA